MQDRELEAVTTGALLRFPVWLKVPDDGRSERRQTGESAHCTTPSQDRRNHEELVCGAGSHDGLPLELALRPGGGDVFFPIRVLATWGLCPGQSHRTSHLWYALLL